MTSLLADDVLVHRIAEALAASVTVHGTEPWLRLSEHELIELHADYDREQWLTDPRARALYLSCGVALLSLRLAIRSCGLRPEIRPACDPAASSTLVASIRLWPGSAPTAAERDLHDALLRGEAADAEVVAAGHDLPEPAELELRRAAESEGAALRLLPFRAAAVLAAQDLAGWVPSWPSRLAALSTAGNQEQDWLQAGQALQRVLLTASRLGLRAGLLYQPIALHDMSDDESACLSAGAPGAGQAQMMIEFGRRPRPRSAGTDLPQAGAARPRGQAAQPREALRS